LTIVRAEDALQDINTIPIPLTVGYNTTLMLIVSARAARLVNDAGNGLSGRTLTPTFNGTQKYNATTDQNGYVTWMLQLSPQANDSATTYNIAVSFAGDPNPKTATAYFARVFRN
jgi:hypothetical protein